MTKKGLLFLNTVVERLAQALVVLIAAASFVPSANAGTELPKIGAVLPLTGELAHFGKPIEEGMEMARKELGPAGFRILYEDDQSLNRASALNGAKRLVDSEHVSVLLNVAVNTMSPISPILNRAHTPGLVLWDSNNELLKQGDYVFGFGYSTEKAGEDLADYAYHKLGLRNLAILTDNDEWSEIISGSFHTRFESLGGKVPMSERTDVDSPDLRALILKAKQLKVDGMYAPLIGRSLTGWMAQTHELKFEGVRLTGDGMGEDEVSEAGKENSEGLIATQIWLENPEFEKRYKAAFPGSDSAIRIGFVGLGYDSVKCLSELRKRSPADFSGEKVLSLLKNFECTGVGGTTNFSKSHLSTRREPVLRVENGKFVPVR